MKKILVEELILTTSVLKWTILAAFIGVIVGASSAFFLKILHFATDFTPRYGNYYLLLPFSLLLSSIFVRYLAPDAKGHGTEKVIEAVHKKAGKISFAVVPVKILATVTTIAAGGSAGKEGPAAQIGAGLASFFAGLFRFDDTDRKKFVICGISAGFAAVFGTPIAGAVFGVEVLFMGGMLYNVLLPSFVAGITSFYVSSALGIDFFYYPVSFSINVSDLFSHNILPVVVMSGFFFGFCSLVFIETMEFFKRIVRGMKTPFFIKPVLGGLFMIILVFLFSDMYLGLGVKTINSVLTGSVLTVAWYAFLLKIIFTSITLNFGGSGGVLTPIFFVGVTSGLLFARLAGVDPVLFASIGFVALLAGAANTPIAASIMAVEMFGSGILMHASLACVISFLITGHRSIFPTQVLNIKKSTSIMVESGTEVENLSVSILRRKKTLTGLFYKISDLLTKHRNR